MSAEDETFVKIFDKNHNLDYRIPEISGKFFSYKRENQHKMLPHKLGNLYNFLN